MDYIARCHKTLKAWGAPLENWICIGIRDLKDEGLLSYKEDGEGEMFTCELCGCERVRFIHDMQHDEYFEDVSVGCICAGTMEGDILAAQERERILENRSKRKQNYLKKEWQVKPNGNRTLRYKKGWITIIPSKYGGFGIVYHGKSVWKHKNRKINDFLTAVHVAFDLVDPKEELE